MASEARTGPVVRGPQLALAQHDSIVVAWRSAKPVIGTLACSSGHRLTDVAPTNEHVFTIPGLDPDAGYDYTLEHDGDVVSSGHHFRTAPSPGTGSVRFAVVGDCGAHTEAQRDVIAGMARSRPDLVLITGDVVYEHGAESALDPAYFLPFRALIDRVPFYPALGNHDVETRDGRPLLQSLYLPRNSADGSERFYSFDRGPAHFVALDSTRELGPGSIQGNWLASDLATNTRAWTILYLHHPPYSSSKHGSDRRVRAAIAPLCSRYGVDVVFAGHDHVYERSHPLDGGTVYVVTGGGGKSLYVAGRSDFTATSVAAYHHVVVEIEGDRLRVDAIDRRNVAIDSTSITKRR
ncbi:MAG: metallophosphoesterase family protein [Planctomycetota bacterium]